MTITKTTESDTDTDCRYITMAGRYILTCHFLKGNPGRIRLGNLNHPLTAPKGTFARPEITQESLRPGAAHFGVIHEGFFSCQIIEIVAFSAGIHYNGIIPMLGACAQAHSPLKRIQNAYSKERCLWEIEHSEAVSIRRR